MTILLISWQHPFAGTSRSRHRTRFIPAPANAARASPTRPRSGRRARQHRSIHRRTRLSALSDLAKSFHGKVAAPPNLHRRAAPHRFPAGSFFGGFPTPALLPRIPLAPGRHPKPFPQAAVPRRLRCHSRAGYVWRSNLTLWDGSALVPDLSRPMPSVASYLPHQCRMSFYLANPSPRLIIDN